MSWRDRAACADQPPYLWDVEDHRWPQGRLICGTCPVRLECLADAMDSEPTNAHGRWGIRGGLRPDEREALGKRRRRRRRSA